MQIKPIKTVEENEAALKRIEQLLDVGPTAPEKDELESLVSQVMAFEEEHYPIELPDPASAINFRMQQQS